jgi:ATP-dependent Clp protease ATP-binding subunit ClpA
MEPLVMASFDEARAHSHTWVGAEHLLVALTKEPPGSPAREALMACGVSEGSVAMLLSKLPAEPDNRKGVSPNPRFYGIEGRAEGLAIRAGKARPTGEEFLLALIWESQGPHTRLLNDIGATSGALQAALAAQGVTVPDAEPPPFDNTKWGERVSILRREYDEGLPSQIARLLPKGTRFGCNVRGDDAWVVAEEGVELTSYIEQARRSAGPADEPS